MSLQEQPLPAPPVIPDVRRDRSPRSHGPDAVAVRTTLEFLGEARRPLFLLGRLSRDEQDWDRRVALAERHGALVISDLKNGAAFPAGHPLHPNPPGIFLPAASAELIGAADLILREITVGVVAPAYVNVPLWVAQERGFLERRAADAGFTNLGPVAEEFALNAVCARFPAERAVLTAFLQALAEAAEWFRGNIGESAAIAAARTSIETRYALRACQALAAGGVIPHDLRSAPGALAAAVGALRSSGLIPATLLSGAGPDPIAAAVDYSYL